MYYCDCAGYAQIGDEMDDFGNVLFTDEMLTSASFWRAVYSLSEVSEALADIIILPKSEN